MDLGLAGRSALITGSYRGTGRGIAQVLAAEGAHVVVHGFESGQPDDAVRSIIEAGGSAEGIVADIMQDDALSTLNDELATVDVLVNNYGAPRGSTWESMDKWADEWNANVLTSIRVTQACLSGMCDRGWGRIIFLGTAGTQQPGTRNPGYYGAKTALPTLVRTLAIELRGTGITVNLVSPGMIATDEVKAMVTRRAAREGVDESWAEVEKWAVQNSMPNLTERIPTPEDIGRVVAFIASEGAWHINGADLPVDGGSRDA